MNPDKHYTVEDTKGAPAATDELMQWLGDLQTETEIQRSRIEHRAARNMRLVKGLPVEDQSIVSNVRKRRKLYYRKIWSNGYRILASFYQAFLKDQNQVKFEGRDEDKDPAAAKVLQKLVEYYRDRLMRRASLFVQFMWNFLDIIFLGDTNGKLWWHYNKATGADYLDYKAYPMEQVGRDYSAVIPSEGRYYYFENYVTYGELEELGYSATVLADVKPCSVRSSPLRSVRYFKGPDPLMNVANNPETNYPESGTGQQPPADQPGNLYRSIEWFYKKKGKWIFCVTNPEGKVWLKKPLISPYGDISVLVTGSMLLEAHKAVGEGLAEPMEGPQESLNYNINVRKDNVDMALRVRPVYDRDANVDIAALLDHKTGLPIGVDGDVNAAVKFDRPPDVTQSSYVEGSADMTIMDDYAGTNPTKQGNTNVDKTGVAEINQMEGGAKIDLFTATAGETFFRQWYYTAAQLVSKFCTDEKAIRIANEALRKEDPAALKNGKTVYDLEDLDLDVIVKVGISSVGRQIQIQQHNMFIGQAIQANNVTALMLKSGIPLPEGLTLLNVSKMLIDLAPTLDIKNVKDYELPVGGPAQAPPPPPDGGGAVTQKAAGDSAPQPNAPANGAGLPAVLQRVFSHGAVNASFPKGER